MSLFKAKRHYQTTFLQIVEIHTVETSHLYFNISMVLHYIASFLIFVTNIEYWIVAWSFVWVLTYFQLQIWVKAGRKLFVFPFLILTSCTLKILQQFSTNYFIVEKDNIAW